MNNILPFPARRAIGAVSRQYPQHEPSMTHEEYYQTALKEAHMKIAEASYAFRAAMKPEAGRDEHAIRGVEALKYALVAAISASGCRNEDREIYAALVKGGEW